MQVDRSEYKWISELVWFRNVQSHLRNHTFDTSTLIITAVDGINLVITFYGRKKELQ